jgi:hypothetical protein
MLRDAVPDDDAALRSIFRRASLSNEGDRPLLLANPEHLVWREPTGSDAVRVRIALTTDGFAAAPLPGAHQRPRRQRWGADLSKKVAWGDAAQVEQRLRFLLH